MREDVAILRPLGNPRHQANPGVLLHAQCNGGILEMHNATFHVPNQSGFVLPCARPANHLSRNPKEFDIQPRELPRLRKKSWGGTSQASKNNRMVRC
jgi:hypothetical protein